MVPSAGDAVHPIDTDELHTTFTLPTKSPDTAPVTSIVAEPPGPMVSAVEDRVPANDTTFICRETEWERLPEVAVI